MLKMPLNFFEDFWRRKPALNCRKSQPETIVVGFVTSPGSVTLEAVTRVGNLTETIVKVGDGH